MPVAAGYCCIPLESPGIRELAVPREEGLRSLALVLLTIHGHVTASAMSHGHDVFQVKAKVRWPDRLPVLEAQNASVQSTLPFSV